MPVFPVPRWYLYCFGNGRVDFAVPSSGGCDACRKADGSAMSGQDYDRLLNAQAGELRIVFSFQKEKRTEDQASSEMQEDREEDNVGITGMQEKARRGF